MKILLRLRPWLLLLLMVAWHGSLTPPASGAEPAPDAVRVMSFNLWVGGDGGKQPLEQTLAVIQKGQADIVGLQETAGSAPQGEPRPDRAAEIARRLGWHYLDQGGARGIISRFKIVAATPNKEGALLKLPSGQQLYLFNAHFAASPYQPYQLLNIPYGDGAFLKTEREAIQAAQAARGHQVQQLLAEVQAVLPEGLPVFITGDFNEPSHRDWTPAAVKAHLCPLAVQWPTTKAVEAAGFHDTYRTAHPDPTQQRGLTWTPITALDDPQDRHDRIDFVFASGAPTNTQAAWIVGEAPEFADLIVTPYPSDHRAVVAEVKLPPQPSGQ